MIFFSYIKFVVYWPSCKEYFCGHGLVVEHVLAKDETGVRFSLPAQDVRMFLLKRTDKMKLHFSSYSRRRARKSFQQDKLTLPFNTKGKTVDPQNIRLCLYKFSLPMYLVTSFLA